MKTDRFSDSIRRKLESIRPEFNEKDWARMQATLQQGTPVPSPDATAVHQPFAGSVWSAQPWLMAAAAVSTAVLISVAVWQRTQINDLRSQLSAKQPTQTGGQTASTTEVSGPITSVTEPASPAGSASSDQTEPLAGGKEDVMTRPDTVFITRYVAVPTPSGQSRNQAAQQSVNDLNDGLPNRTDRTQSLANENDQQRSATRPITPRDSAPTATGSPLTEPDPDVVNEAADPTTRPDRRVTATDRTTGVPDVAEESNRVTIPMVTGSATETNNRPATETRTTRRSNERSTNASRPSRTTGIAGRGNRSSAASANTGATGADAGSYPVAVATRGSDAAETDVASNQPAVAYEAVTSRPLTLGTIDWKTPLAYRARRMRPARTTVVGGTAAPSTEPASQPVSQIAFGFRLGAGTDVMNKLTSGSALGELLIGKHLTVTTGLGLASFAGGKFGSDEEFDKNNHQNFRRDYVRGGIDPRNQLMNIGIRTELVQVPLSIGYRIPLNKSFSLFPSVGTTFNLRSREHVTFEYRPPFFRTTETASYQIIRSVDLVNSLSLGTGLEWNRSHWVAQAGPVMTLSARSTVNWQDGACFGLRARVFYQF